MIMIIIWILPVVVLSILALLLVETGTDEILSKLSVGSSRNQASVCQKNTSEPQLSFV